MTCGCCIVPCDPDDPNIDLCEEATNGGGNWKIQLCAYHDVRPAEERFKRARAALALADKASR